MTLSRTISVDIPPPPPPHSGLSINFDIKLMSSPNENSLSILDEWTKYFKEFRDNNSNIDFSVNIDFTQRE